MKSEIKITNQAGSAVIDIEGVIGIPEKMQFETPGQRVATYTRFTEALQNIREVEAEEIIVNIRSTGGDVNDALLIYDALSASGAVVTTRCMGYVASAATIIAQAASPGRREISASAMYLVHCSESAAEGNSRSIMRTKEMLDATDSRIAQIYASRSGQPETRFVELMNENGGNGRWMTAEEVIEAGLADGLIPSAGGKPEMAVNFESLDVMFEMLGLPPIARGDMGAGSNKKGLDAAGIRQWWRIFKRLFFGRNHNDALRHGSAGALSSTAFKSCDRPSDRAVLLCRQTAQDTAYPTSTLPKEDPSPSEFVRTANELAYDADAYGIKNRN